MSVFVTKEQREIIEAELMLDIYNARRRARLRLEGIEPEPAPRPEALQLWRRARHSEAGVPEPVAPSIRAAN